MAKLNVILRDSGGNSKAGYRVAVYNEADELVADTNLPNSMIDNGDGSYVSYEDVNPGTYTVKYATTSSGTLAVVPGYEDFSFGAIFEGTAGIGDGGTGATTVEGAQQNLGVEPGVDVLEYDARFEVMKSTADSLAGSGLNGICASVEPDGLFGFVAPSVARGYLELVPGTDVQEHSSVLDAVAAIAMPEGVDYKFPVISPIEGWIGADAATTRTVLGLGAVPVANGGTGATTVEGAQENLELRPDYEVQRWNDSLQSIADMETSGSGWRFPALALGDAWYALTDEDAREALGLELGADVQTYDARTSTLNASVESFNLINQDAVPVYTHANDTFSLVGVSSARTVLGLGTVATESVVPTSKGGTGSGTLATARANLELAKGIDVQEWSKTLDEIVAIEDGWVAPVFLEMVDDGNGVGEIVGKTAAETKTELGLGTAAEEDYTDSGENLHLPMFNNGFHLPVLAVDPTPGIATAGTLYVKETGSVAGGTWKLCIIKKTGNGITYTYAVHELLAISW